MRAWHFVGDKLRDGRPIPADGEWLVHEGPVQICESGLHASREPFDALKYAPGATVCLVECEDVVEEQADKLVCRRRRIVARMDVTELLRRFARLRALSVIHLWRSDPPDVVLEYLMTGAERAAAYDAAYDAALSSANDAAHAAAHAAASNAVSAARAAGQNAVWAASGAAAGAAWEAAWAAARAEFNALVYECFAPWLEPQGEGV